MVSQGASAAVITGYATGALIMTFFGSFWGLMTMFGMASRQRIWLILVVLLVTIPLAYFSFSLLQDARQLPHVSSPEGEARGVMMRRGFAIVGGIEFALIAIASILLARAKREELIPLVTALIVGVHFLPLAAIFDVTAYYQTGIAMTLLAGVALIAMFMGKTLGGPYVWSVIVGLGNAAILWGTAFYVSNVGRQLIAASGYST
jgi:hypothetical protein